MSNIRTIPIRRVLNRPNLFLGGDRELVQVSMLLAFVLIIASIDSINSNYYVAVIGIAFWLITLYFLRKLAKFDPLARNIAIRAMTKYRKYYPPRATPFRDNR